MTSEDVVFLTSDQEYFTVEPKKNIQLDTLHDLFVGVSKLGYRVVYIEVTPQLFKALRAPHTLWEAIVLVTDLEHLHENVIRLGCAKSNIVSSLELISKVSDSYVYTAKTFLAEETQYLGECFRYDELWIKEGAAVENLGSTTHHFWCYCVPHRRTCPSIGLC